MTKFTMQDYEEAISGLWKQFHKLPEGKEKERLRQIGRALEKKKAVAFAEMILNEDER